MVEPTTADKSLENEIPRFVLSITDTKTTMQGPQGEQYMMISVGADSLAQFNKVLPEAEQTSEYKTELQKLFVYFQEQVDTADANGNEYTQVEIKKD